MVSPASPASGATGVNGAGSVTFRTDGTVDLAAISTSVSPPTPGRWSAGPGRLVFTPTGAFPPSTRVVISVSPAAAAVGDPRPIASVTTSFVTAPGSVLRLQQLLAALGYLPVRWAPAGGPAASLVAGSAGAQRAVYSPPAGTFTWTWSAPPAPLVAQWSPGNYTTMVKGAVMAFEADQSLAVDGIAGPLVWSHLLAATVGSGAGYTYALASKTAPETLSVWHDGTLVATSPANTGIPVAPTADGTFPVYERLATQVMKGTNPNGSHYADPVAWVAYFNGGDAIHYIARSSYGYPQSLGCVEVPYQVGKTIWPDLTIGTLVTVTG